MKDQSKLNALHPSALQAKEMRKQMFQTVHKREAEMQKQFQLNRKRVKTR